MKVAQLAVANTAVPLYEKGEILVWKVPSGSIGALATAYEMGARADAHLLGTWNVAAIGESDRFAYFDLTLNWDLDAIRAKLIFDSCPDAY